MWIDIYSVADHTARLGASQLPASRRRRSRRLDQQAAAVLPCLRVDERRIPVQARRWAVCRGIIGNTPVDLGSFIVDNLSTDLTTPKRLS